MNIKLRVILLTMLISLLVWAVCAALGLILFRQSVPAAGFTSNQVILSVSTFIVVLAASVAVGLIMSRTMLQRRKALEELKESEERVHALSEATVEGIIIHDGSIFLEANDVSARMLGLEPSEIRGKSFVDYIAPESRELVLHNIREGFTEPYEVILRREGGTTFSAELCGRDTTYKGKKVRVVSMRDITQRKKIEVEIRFRGDLLDACSDSMMFHDFDGTPIYINEAACRAHGYTHKEMMKVNFRRLIVPEYGRMLRSEIEEIEKKGDVIFESAHYRKDGSILPLEIHARIFKWGDKEYILSIGRDITERKKTEAELRFRSELLDACSDSLLWSDADGNFVYVNEAACKAHGYTHDEMMQVNISKVIVPEYRQIAQSKTEEVLKNGDAVFECAHYRKDGSILPVEIHAHVFKLGDQGHVLTICRDITERKQSEELFKNISLNSPACIFIIQDGKFQFVNPRMIEKFGYTEAELMGIETEQIIHLDDRQKVRGEVTKALGGKQAASIEYRGIRKDGNIILMQGTINLIQHRERRAILGSVVDISKQKEAEEALKKIETEYHELVDVITTGVVIYHAVDNGEDFIFIDFNNAAEKIERISREYVIGKKVTEVFPGVKDFGLFKVFQRVWQTGNTEYFPSAIYKDERDPGTWRENWVYKLPDGDIAAVYNDVTERKLAEETLRKSELSLREAQALGKIGNWEFDVITKKLEWSDEVYRLYERDRKLGPPVLEEEETYYDLVDAKKVDEFVRLAIEEGREFRYDIKANLPSGHMVFLNASVHPIKDKDGHVGKLFGTVQDITARKLAEEALQMSEKNFRTSLDDSPLGIRISDIDNQTLYENQALLDIFGYKDIDEVRAKSPQEYYSPECYAEYLNMREKYGRGEIVPDQVDIDIIRKDGTVRHLQALFKVIFWDGRKQYQTLYNDITARKQSEEALRTSEMNFRNSIDGSPLGVCIVTTEGKTVYTNRRFLDMYGYESLEEYWSKPPEERYTPESYQGYLERKEKRNRGDVTDFNYKLSIIRKDGQIRQTEVFSKIVLWGGKSHFQVLYTDITERVLAENALRASEERFRRLAENIPDIISRFDFIPSRGYEYVSPASTFVTGYEPEEYYANPELGSDMIYPEDKGLQQTMANKPELYKGVPLTTRYIRKDGRVIWVERRQMPIYDESGKLVALEGIDRDVTEEIRMEEALRVSEMNFRNSMDKSPLGVRIVSPDGETIYGNNKFLEMYGYENLAEFRSKSVQERYISENLVREDARQGSAQYPEQYEISIIHKDGSNRHLEVFRKKVLWGGEPQFQMLYNDVTARKKTEQELKESEKKYRELVETAQEGILISDNDSKITFVNQRMCEMQGYTEAELVGKHVSEFLNERGTEIFKREVEYRRVGIKGEYDTQILHKNGSLIYVRVGSTPLYDNDGKYIGVMSVIVDISALKNAEEHILHLNSVLNALRGISQLITLEKDRGSLLQKSCDLLVNARGYETAWVALTDGNGKFVSGVSSGIESKIFSPILKDFIKGKYPPCTGDLLQQKENILLCPQLGSQHTDCPLEELGDNLGNLTGRLEYDGRLYGVLSVQLPSKLAGNKEEQELFKELTGDVAFALDSLEKATQLAEAEAKAREAEKLREVDRLRSELLANVSHELRTPLASIKGYTSTLLRTDVKWAESQRLDFLRTVDVETDRLTKLINDILDMSRIDGGALKLRQEQYQISEILNSIIGRLKAITSDHQLKINIPKKLPAVFADEMRIGQVISNLVDNATKFSPTGTEISISAIHDKDRVIVSVMDRGVGMSKEVMSQLFNRFYQADNVVTGRRHGTGLGLAICRGIIESHGGKIWVESKVGEGSKFSFSLPLRKEESNA